MVQAPWLAAHLPLSCAHGVDERSGLLGAECAEAQPLGEPLPVVTFSLVFHRAPRHGAELVDRPAATGSAEDAVVGGHQPRLLEVKQTRQELAPREVSKRTEQDDDVRIRDHHVGRGHHAIIAPGAQGQGRSRCCAGRDSFSRAIDLNVERHRLAS